VYKILHNAFDGREQMLKQKENVMNRVQKKFLIKIAPPFAIMAYVYAVIKLFTYAPNVYVAGGILGVGFVAPVCYFFFREAWKDAKWEVERENEIMLNTLKD
jgi:uncharacterized membrane protein